ncbi:hypothetical protein ACJJTC_009247 [Scirpophaga incertulas]
MPRNYQRKSQRQTWSPESMQKAIETSTRRRHALEVNKTLPPNTKGLGSFKLTFPPEVERKLVEHLKFLETRLFGLTRKSVQELAFELAEKNGFVHCLNREKNAQAKNGWMAF